MTDNKKQVLDDRLLKKVAGGVDDDSDDTGGGIIPNFDPAYIKTGGGGNGETAPVTTPIGKPSYVKN